MVKNDKSLTLFFILALNILIQTLLVQLSYNQIWPKLVYNTGLHQKHFRELNFYEALLVVILFKM